jgi:alpha-N-arabinofuranosidase
MVCEQKIYLHSRFHKGNVSPLVFGGFLEHLGRAVYGGVFDPTSKHAGKDGLRSDVLNALESLGMTIMRWPGGNFVSDYHWEDGVGPREQRPTVRNLAWTSMESNEFGQTSF